MASYRATVASTWTQEQTFDYLVDFRNVEQWDPSMADVQLLGGAPGRIGARYRLAMSVAGRTTPMEYEAVELERPARFVMRCETPALLSIDTVSVDAEGSVTYQAELKLRGVRRLLDPLAQLALSRASARARDYLAQRLARPAE